MIYLIIKYYSNIITKIKSNIQISPEMIIKKDLVDYKTRKTTGKKEAIYKHSLNVEYWKSIKDPINVVLDEAHSILNARRSTRCSSPPSTVPTSSAPSPSDATGAPRLPLAMGRHWAAR